MLKPIPVKEAIGTRLVQDVTEVRPNEFKGPAFRKGHLVCDSDICHLQKLGKNHLYQMELDADEIHENEAASILARALSGKGITWQDDPKEGKIELRAALDGLLTINTDSLTSFNMVDEVMCATLHRHTLVKKNDKVAATRAIPLVMKREPVLQAAAIAEASQGIISVQPLRQAKVGLVITGNEVFSGLIKDRFEPVLTEKVIGIGSHISSVEFTPDDDQLIKQAIDKHLSDGCDLILLSGGMSVDPDDVTRKGVRNAGATEMNYGSAVLPGAMFLAAYIGEVPLLGIPACGMYHSITVLDLVLPRILAGQHIGKRELAALGHGGMCMDCKTCVYPHCPFGKGA